MMEEWAGSVIGATLMAWVRVTPERERRSRFGVATS